MTPEQLTTSKLRDLFIFLVDEYEFKHDESWTKFESRDIVVDIGFGIMNVGIGIRAKKNDDLATSLDWFLISRSIPIEHGPYLVDNMRIQANLLKVYAPTLFSGDLGWLSQTVKYMKKASSKKSKK